jgi:hypothetical protein
MRGHGQRALALQAQAEYSGRREIIVVMRVAEAAHCYYCTGLDQLTWQWAHTGAVWCALAGGRAAATAAPEAGRHNGHFGGGGGGGGRRCWVKQNPHSD